MPEFELGVILTWPLNSKFLEIVVLHGASVKEMPARPAADDELAVFDFGHVRVLGCFPTIERLAVEEGVVAIDIGLGFVGADSDGECEQERESKH